MASRTDDIEIINPQVVDGHDGNSLMVEGESVIIEDVAGDEEVSEFKLNREQPIQMMQETNGASFHSAKPYKQIGPKDELSLLDVEEMLSTPDKEGVSPLVPPWRPKAGDVFVFKIDRNETIFAKELRCDGYPWKADGSKPLKGGLIKKFYRKLRIPGNESDMRFQRHEYIMPGDMTYVVFHYLGDERVYVPRPHGNAKKNPTKPYIRSPFPKVRAPKRPLTDTMMMSYGDQSLREGSSSNLDDRILLKQFRVLELQEEYMRLKIKHKKMEIDQMLVTNGHVTVERLSPSQLNSADSGHYQFFEQPGGQVIMATHMQ